MIQGPGLQFGLFWIQCLYWALMNHYRFSILVDSKLKTSQTLILPLPKQVSVL